MAFSWRRVTVESGKFEPVDWPGDAQGVIAAPAENVVLYWGLPTTGSPIKYTKHNSALRGPKLMLTVKVAEINSRQFQTLIPEIDPRSRVSFGRSLTKQ